MPLHVLFHQAIICTSCIAIGWYGQGANLVTLLLLCGVDNGVKSFDYFEGQRKSIFCLAAAGWGWGQRMKIGITHGCIPVIVQVCAGVGEIVQQQTATNGASVPSAELV